PIVAAPTLSDNPVAARSARGADADGRAGGRRLASAGPLSWVENGAGALPLARMANSFCLRKIGNLGTIPSCEPQFKRKRINAVLRRDAAFLRGGWVPRRINSHALARNPLKRLISVERIQGIPRKSNLRNPQICGAGASHRGGLRKSKC